MERAEFIARAMIALSATFLEPHECATRAVKLWQEYSKTVQGTTK